ncbi:MAG: hypothetical protein M3270_05575 [Thermoproteota archaeon]|nr:hypothetical protein [Thermoproteota archaeon]
MLISNQVVTTPHPTSGIVIMQCRMKKYIPNSFTNMIHGKNDQLSLRLDAHIPTGRGGHKEARNDTWKGLSSWADHTARRSRKND